MHDNCRAGSTHFLCCFRMWSARTKAPRSEGMLSKPAMWTILMPFLFASSSKRLIILRTQGLSPVQNNELLYQKHSRLQGSQNMQLKLYRTCISKSARVEPWPSNCCTHARCNFLSMCIPKIFGTR